VAASDVVEAAPTGVGVFEFPVAVSEDPIVGPDAHDLCDEQVVGARCVRVREEVGLFRGDRKDAVVLG